MAHSVRGRQGCRPLRPGWSMVRTSGGTRRSRPTSGTVVCSWFGGNGKAAVHHPVRGGDGGLAAYAAGIAPSADGALGRWGSSRRARRGGFARCDGRVFRPLRRATRGAASGLRDFGLHAVRWQEWSPRNFASGQGVGSQPYWMYGKKPHRRHGAKGPASTADTRAVGSPTRKKSSKTFIFFAYGGGYRRDRRPYSLARPPSAVSRYCWDK